MQIDEKDQVRFWSKVAVSDQDSCWLWKASTDGRGYGSFYFNGRSMKAHRFAWMTLHNKPFPHGLSGCHSCDNPSCVNPHHVWPGTQKENALDALRKGRLCLPAVRFLGAYNRLKTHCRNGHEYSPENVRLKPTGERVCRACHKKHKKANKKKARLAKQALALPAQGSDNG